MWTIPLNLFEAVVALGGIMVTLVGLWKVIMGTVRGIKSLLRKDVERVVQKDPTR